MRRTLLAASLAIPLLLAWNMPTFAAYPTQCSFGHGGGGFCMGFCSKMHQHGPLFNYGPYYGYPPFEPYGPWNAYLQYNPSYYGSGNGRSHGGLFQGRCGGCGLHAHFLQGGWFRGHACLGCGRGGGWLAGLGHRNSCTSCDTCGSAAAPQPPAPGKGAATSQGDTFAPAKTDAVTRYAGAGSPEQFAGYYAQLPSLEPVATAAGY